MIYATPVLGPEELAAVNRIQDLRSSLRFHVSEPKRWMGPVRRVLAARAIQGSNSIEGYNVSVEDAVAAIQGEEPNDARLEDWQAVRSYRRALTYVLQLAQDQHFAYSSALLKSLHFMMTEYSLEAGPGLWRPGSIWVQNDETGEVVYEAPEAELVPSLVEEIVVQLNEDHDTLPSVRAAMAHLNLVMVHPFRDGNGRMARCLQTLALARDGILAPEFSSIEEYLGRNTHRYYQVLAQVGEGKWNPALDARPWVRFSLEAHYIQASSVLRRIQESELISAEIDTLIEPLKLPDRVFVALFDATSGLHLRNAAYRGAVKSWDNEEISVQVATKDLGLAVKAGLLTKRGEKRGSYYVAGQPLLDIRSKIRSDRRPISADGIFTPDTQRSLLDD